jgi:predicted transcriptional regulator of viral defense system
VTARALILAFLRAVGEARIERIVRFMDTQPLSYAPGTTRNTLGELARAGEIARVRRGVYRHRGDR